VELDTCNGRALQVILTDATPRFISCMQLGLPSLSSSFSSFPCSSCILSICLRNDSTHGSYHLIFITHLGRKDSSRDELEEGEIRSTKKARASRRWNKEKRVLLLSSPHNILLHEEPTIITNKKQPPRPFANLNF
jgi:hypothetical protein